MKILKDHKLLIFLILIAFVGKFLWLGIFPPGMAPDEMDMVLTAKTIAHSGKDISGVPFPLFFIKSWAGARQPNVIPFLLSPYFAVFNVNLLTARLPFVFINLLLGIGVVKFIRIFEKDEALSLITFLVFLASPWMFIYSRVTFAAPVSLMFLVWGLYFLFKKKERLGWALAAFVLSSLCYIGSLFLVPLLVGPIFVYKAWDKKAFLKYGLFLGLFVVFVGGYILTAHFVKDSTIGRRETELSVFGIDGVSEKVNDARRLSLEIPGKEYAINKYTVFVGQRLKDYINVFNVRSLFLTGDPGFNFAFTGRGLLHLISLPLLVLGIAVIAKKHRKLGGVLAITAAIAPLGAAASSITYTFIYRAFPMAFVFVALISLGLWSLTMTPLKNLFLIVYFGFYVSFLFFYFFQYPVLSDERFGVAERTAAGLAMREAEGGNRVRIIDTHPYSMVNRLSLYGGGEIVYTSPSKHEYEVGNIFLTDKCEVGESKVLIVDEKIECPDLSEDYLVIQQQKDAGYRYKVYGSSVCENVSLENYKRLHLISDYKMENLGNEEFCNRWIFEPI